MDKCPHCQVDLEDRDTDVRCWKCGWTVRCVDTPCEFYDRADAIAARDAEGR